MFERLTERARKVVVPSQEEAVEMVGQVSLETLPRMREVEVTVSAEPRPGERSIPGFSLSATFRR